MKDTEMGFAVGIVMGLLIGVMISCWMKDQIKQEAVERNYAEWTVDSKGETKWRWKEVQP